MSALVSTPSGSAQPGGAAAEASQTRSVPAAVGSALESTAASLPSAGIALSERALILRNTNELRAANGLSPLRLNHALNDVAQDWAEKQAASGVMKHRVGLASLYPAGWSRAAENVAMGYQPGSVLDAWAASTGHRANLLSSNTDTGIGAARDARGRWFYTQNFGRYASAPPPVPGSMNRIAGPDRYAVSAQTSARTFPAGASTVYVASGANFPDALSASALAGAARGPLLLVAPDSVPQAVLTELRRLSPARVVVAGGPGSVKRLRGRRPPNGRRPRRPHLRSRPLRGLAPSRRRCLRRHRGADGVRGDRVGIRRRSRRAASRRPCTARSARKHRPTSCCSAGMRRSPRRWPASTAAERRLPARR